MWIVLTSSVPPYKIAVTIKSDSFKPTKKKFLQRVFPMIKNHY